MRYIDVDGSLGEGGGQILRTALAFSVIKGAPVRVSKVRAGREVPGLRRQHVSALHVLAEIFDGKLTGDIEGSSEVTFVPGEFKVRSLRLDMRTAASITLVLQAVVPAAALLSPGVSIELLGGTDVPWSPTFDYFATVVREGYSCMGIEFEATALRRGYYPRGGGQTSTIVHPSLGVRRLDLVDQPEVRDVVVLSRCGRLPNHVAQRQKDAAVSALKKRGIQVSEATVSVEDADSPGSSLLVCSLGGGELLGCDSLGERGKSAEEVGREAAEALAATIDSGATLDANLADMVLPLLSLADGPSRAKVPMVTPHLETGLTIAKLFTSCDYRTSESGGCWTVEVSPAPAGRPART